MVGGGKTHHRIGRANDHRKGRRPKNEWALGTAERRKGGIVVLPQNQLPPGVYAVALRADGILVGVVKFIALR